MSKLPDYGNYTLGLYGLPHMGEVIANYRVKAGWNSQEAFAIVCGVDKQTVVYWERQQYLADMDRRIFLCRLLKIPPAYLGLTWRSVLDKDKADTFTHAFEQVAELLEENAYALYEDILIFAYTSTDKYSSAAAYRFYKHQQELERIVEQAPEIEKDTWKDLLSRYYQHSTFIAQHHKQDDLALTLANQAVAIASSMNDNELLGASLYRRSRVHLIQNRRDLAKIDIQNALNNAEKARGPLKGSSYLLAAEVNAFYAEGDEQLKTQCRKWQDKAANLIYKGQAEDDGTYLTFSLHAIHHERAKTLLRFAMFHTTNDELVERLKNPHTSVNKGLLKDAQSALTATRTHLAQNSFTQEMYVSITEATLYLIAKEFEAGARTGKSALQCARKAHSKQGIWEVRKLYTMLNKLAPENPHVRNLGVELGIY